MNRRFVHPLTLVISACAATLVVWLNCNYRISPLVERTSFTNPQDHVAYQFKQLQYDMYKDKAFGWPKDAYTTTLDRIKDPAKPLAPMAPLKVLGTWNSSGVAIDAAVGMLIIAVSGLISELVMRRVAKREKPAAATA
jgi:hypothetical protein